MVEEELECPLVGLPGSLASGTEERWLWEASKVVGTGGPEMGVRVLPSESLTPRESLKLLL